MTPEEAIQQQLQIAAQQGAHFVPPPMAMMPEGEDAPSGYASPQMNMQQGALPIGNPGEQIQIQMLEVMKTLLERVGNLALVADRMAAQQGSQQQTQSAPQQTAQEGGPTPAQQEQAVDDFKKLTGKDLAKVADPKEAVKQITYDRQQEAKENLDKKLKAGNLTDKQYEKELQKSNREIAKKTQSQADRGVLDKEIEEQAKASVNHEIDMAAGKKGTSDDKVQGIKEGLGTQPQQQSQQSSGVAEESLKMQRQANQQTTAILQQMIQMQRQSLDDWKQTSQKLDQLAETVQHLQSQGDSTRQQNQRGGYGK